MLSTSMCDVPLHYAEIDACIRNQGCAYQRILSEASGALLRALCSGSQGSGFGGVHHLLVAGSAHFHAGWVTNGIDDI